MKKINKDTFCYLPFGSVYVTPTGLLTPCCIAEPFAEEINWKEFNSIDELINSAPYKRIRKQLVEGIKPPECNACFVHNNIHREGSNREFEKYILEDDLYNEDFTVNKVTYVDLRLSNMCNFACRMCFHGLSSTWYEYWGYIQGKPEYNNNVPKFLVADEKGIQKFSKNNIDTISKIYLAGGEPFINPQTFELLDRFSDDQASKVTVLINTNLSTLKYKGVSILDKLKRFKHVQFACSCDGLNKIGEYQRPGFNTERFLNNLKELVDNTINNDNFYVEIDYTLSIMNVFHTKDFIEIIGENYLDRDRIRLHSVVEPLYFSVGFLSKKTKLEIIDLYEKYRKEYSSYPLLVESMRVFIEYVKGSFSSEVKENYRKILGDMKLSVEETLRRFDEVHETDYREISPLFEEIIRNSKKQLF